jgi:hypothetical protein
VDEVLKSLEKGEPSAAARLLDRLAAGPLPATEVLPRLWEAFRTLLRRRGYFVDSPSQVSDSLREIAEIGAGFDLHDLATTLARLHTGSTHCGRSRVPLGIPELEGFTRGCGCGRLGQEGDPR